MTIREIIIEEINSLAKKELNLLNCKIDRNNQSFIQLLNLNLLIIDDKPRKISFSKNFKVPQEYLEGFESILKKCMSGTGGIFKHQSRRLFRGSQLDLMFCDFGIHHLHLGVQSDSKHKGMIEGTKDVVFVYLNDEEIFFIKIATHHEWHLKNTLEILHRERQDLIQHRVVHGVIGENLKDEEILALRSNGYTYFLDIDGACYMPEQLWGGKNTLKTQCNFIRLIYRFEQLVEEKILETLNKDKIFDSDEIDLTFTKFDFKKFEYLCFELVIDGQTEKYKEIL